MKPFPLTLIAGCCLATLVAACGPSVKDGSGSPGDPGSGGTDSGTIGAGCPSPSVPENTPALCSDGIDNDCSGLTDCDDPSCSGIGACPVCGQVQHPESGGLALPDGVGSSACSAPGTATGCPATQLCYATPDNRDGNANECRVPYTSSLNFTGFGATQTMTAVSNLQSVCVTIEHSWVRDLEIDLVSPSGQIIALDAFQGQQGGEVYLGLANDCDEGDPVPGVGSDYCWTPTATNPNMIAYANSKMPMDTVTNCHGSSSQELPPGNYAASGAWTSLLGSTLNGNWTLRVADLWPEDNGYIFKWSLAFDPTIVQDCSGPVIQ